MVLFFMDIFFQITISLVINFFVFLNLRNIFAKLEMSAIIKLFLLDWNIVPTPHLY